MNDNQDFRDVEYEVTRDEAPVWRRPGEDGGQSESRPQDQTIPNPFEQERRFGPRVRNTDGTDRNAGYSGPVQYQGGFGPEQDTINQDQIHEYAFYFIRGKGTSEPTPRMVEMTATGKGFNFPAFLFGFIYYIYRKLYVEALAAFLIAMGVSSLLGDVIPQWAATLAFSVAFGFFFPTFYKNKLEKKINEARGRNQDIRQTLIEAGGVNVVAVVIICVLYFLLLFLLSTRF